MAREYSAEVIALRDRVKLGNEKLFLAWQQIKGFANDKERWSKEMDRWCGAQLLLQGYCTDLKTRGYDACLYLDEGGKKMRGCLSNPNGFWCQVCPSAFPYWEQELMDLPGPRRRGYPERGEEQKVFLEKLGEI